MIISETSEECRDQKKTTPSPSIFSSSNLPEDSINMTLYGDNRFTEELDSFMNQENQQVYYLGDSMKVK